SDFALVENSPGISGVRTHIDDGDQCLSCAADGAIPHPVAATDYEIAAARDAVEWRFGQCRHRGIGTRTDYSFRPGRRCGGCFSHCADVRLPELHYVRYGRNVDRCLAV